MSTPGSYGQDISKVYPLGPCIVSFNGNNLGHTDETGVKLVMKGTILQTMVSRYGKAATNAFMNGQQVDAEFVLMQTDMQILSSAFGLATLVTDSSNNQKLTFGQISGTKIPAYTLSLTTELTEYPIVTWTMQAYPEGDFSPVYEGGKWAGYKCKFVGVINESGAANGSYMGQFGDPTITADAVAPTVSAVVPANAATGVATSATVVATISKALSGPTVNTNTVILIEDPTGTPAQIPGTVTLVNNGSSTTVTFTPNSALTSGKSYTFSMSENITDIPGNALASGAGFLSHFAT